MTAIRFAIALTVAVAATTRLPAQSTPLTGLLADAFAADQAAASVRTIMRVIVGSEDTRYVIERGSPGRLRLTITGSSGEHELMVIDDRVYQRAAGTWQRMPRPPIQSPPSMLPLLLRRTTALTELPSIMSAGIQLRVLTTPFDWPGAPPHNVGTLQLTIEAARKRLRRLLFTGTCHALPCSIEQSLDYDAPISIEPPPE